MKKTQMSTLRNDTLLLWNASKITTIFLYTIGVFTGFMPLMLAIVSGKLIQSLVGARGINIFTSDVNSSMIELMLLLIFSIVSIYIYSFFDGKAKFILKKSRNLIAFISVAIAVLPISPIIFLLIFVGFIATNKQDTFKINVIKTIGITTFVLLEIWKVFQMIVHEGVDLESGIFSICLLVLLPLLILNIKEV